MENYLLVVYVTLDQEKAIRVLFQQRGWFFHKTDIQSFQREGFLNGLTSPSVMLQGFDESEAYQAINLQDRLHTGFDQDLSQFHGTHTHNGTDHGLPAKSGIPDYASSINDEVQSYGGTNIVNCQKNKKSFLEELNSIDEEEDAKYISVEDVPLNNTTNHAHAKSEDEYTEVATEGTLHYNVPISTHELKDITIKVNRLKTTTNHADTKSEDECSEPERAVNNDDYSPTHGLNNLTKTMQNSLSKSEGIVTSGEEDQLKSSNLKYRDKKLDIKMKIERGKKAFLDKKKKRQDALKKHNTSKVDIKRNLRENRMTHKKRPIHCDDCNITFTSLKRFEGHKAKNGGQCVFTCEYCGKVFKYRKSKYLLHIKSAHTKERPHICQTCGKGFVTSDKLKIHLRTHTGEKPCICEQCGRSFYSRAELSIHKDYHHISRENQDEMKCDICNVTFCSKRYLMYHKSVTHCEQRDFLCNKCEKRFKCNSALQRHLKYMHTESRDFNCKVCDKSFKTPACLRKHNLRHGGERNYLCSYCDKAFYEKSKLLQHERIHTGEKPYKCDLCDYRCALSGNLSKHRKTHARV